MNKHKFNKKYQGVFNKFKDYYTTDNYELDWIDEIHLPFWFCKQEIIVQTHIEADVFSKILLEMVDSSIKKHSDICQFLGIKEDDFTLMQLHFLISNGFLEENIEKNGVHYEITHEGRNFLKGKENLDKIEKTDFEYAINDLDFLTEKKYLSYYSDLTKDFFDKSKDIDNPDKDNKNNFSGYNIIETHKLKKMKNFPVNHIPHSDKPTLNKIKNSDFIEFFNKSYSNGIFYDYGANKVDAHKRSILFYLLYFINEEDDCKVEIRRCKSSVKKFNGEAIEKKMSSKVKKYLETNSDFIKKLKNQYQTENG